MENSRTIPRDTCRNGHSLAKPGSFRMVRGRRKDGSRAVWRVCHLCFLQRRRRVVAKRRRERRCLYCGKPSQPRRKLCFPCAKGDASRAMAYRSAKKEKLRA